VTSALIADLERGLAAREAAGLQRIRRTLASPQGARVVVDGRELVAFASNDYLGLANHPEVVAAARDGAARWGVGAGASHLICGHFAPHAALETELAAFVRPCAGARALTFSSGYLANLAILTALAGRSDAIFADRLNHACLNDGALLSRAEFVRYPHADAAALRRRLAASKAKRKLIATDAVFSMDGDLAPLPALCALAEQFGCIMMVDDAHASGVFGRQGRGTVDHFDVHGRVDIQVGTLSKAFGVLGGYVAGSAALVTFLQQRARPFLFSTSHPPAIAAACLAALDLVEQEPDRLTRLWDNTAFFHAGLRSLGFALGATESPITPVMVGDASRAMMLSDRLFARGVFAQGIAFPTVAHGQARVRAIVTATHTKDHLQTALDAFAGAGHDLGIV